MLPGTPQLSWTFIILHFTLHKNFSKVKKRLLRLLMCRLYPSPGSHSQVWAKKCSIITPVTIKTIHQNLAHSSQKHAWLSSTFPCNLMRDATEKITMVKIKNLVLHNYPVYFCVLPLWSSLALSQAFFSLFPFPPHPSLPPPHQCIIGGQWWFWCWNPTYPAAVDRPSVLSGYVAINVNNQWS